MTMRWLWLPVALIGMVMLLYGVRLGQDQTVYRYARSLCMACIGLE